MKIYDFTIKSPRGLHAQPCAAIARKSSSKVIMEHNGQIIDVADPIQMMTSSASLGEHIIIKVSGNDEEDILLKLKEIIDSQL
jgi:phosphotransferase system HPr (HPr) family protein